MVEELGNIFLPMAFIGILIFPFLKLGSSITEFHYIMTVPEHFTIFICCYSYFRDGETKHKV